MESIDRNKSLRRGANFGHNGHRSLRSRLLGLRPRGQRTSAEARYRTRYRLSRGTVRAGASAQLQDPAFLELGSDGRQCRRGSQWSRGRRRRCSKSGAGVVTHIWFTINSQDPMHLKNLVLRAWWDGETTPSVEAPIGDFFGLGLGEYFVYQSALLAVAPVKALNAYFQMPFSTAARITLTNEGTVRTDNLYFAIDYVTLPVLPGDLGRFHAQYRQAAPCKGWTDDGRNGAPASTTKNLSGKDNYVFLEATGKGHFVGVTHAVVQNQERLVWRRRRHDLHRRRHDAHHQRNRNGGLLQRGMGFWRPGIRLHAQGRAVHRGPGADRRAILPISLAHREPNHV